MADLITDFNKVRLPTEQKAQTQAQNQGKQERTPSKFWVNVGVLREGPDGAVLISLPFGIPLDKLTAPEIPPSTTKNPDFRNQMIAKTELWKLMEAQMQTMKPGDSVMLPFQVELRMTKEKEGITEEDVHSNPYGIGKLF